MAAHKSFLLVALTILVELLVAAKCAHEQTGTSAGLSLSLVQLQEQLDRDCYSERGAFGRKGQCGDPNETRKQAAYTNKEGVDRYQDFCFAEAAFPERETLVTKLAGRNEYLANIKEFNEKNKKFNV
ncbi:unnamed protein product [Vitrella brassicaformis CCMP3155]|uniref:Uncharacterized protein n=1 Tax=Vitrella brassicaformis (strain CCMP3155) TaxID=1169540 RepID=A0A0G4EWK0_VITBC|nr:unnamed protein product [Vitrella brassicaformis CCMP3155]|eukprot:CEM02731.1 unnamed protein product [Vitrella brassicaformis CCMP3155]